jgi:hypothetical protein
VSDQQQQPADAVAAATAILDRLELDHAKLIDDGRELVQRRQEISFDAHTGDAAAKKKLDAIVGQIVSHDQQVLSVEAAIAEAQARVIAARNAEAQAVDRKNALELRAALKEFISCGESLDEAAAALAEEGTALREALNLMHILGSPFPTHEQLNVLGTDAMLTALAATPWKREFWTLQPRERRGFGALVREWASRIEQTNIKPRLGEAEQQTNEAA